ncbi:MULTISPECIES: LuxR C-terminal-related transcriptional regulator [Brucella]|uniref:Bacterial regulatory, luxR family protein n=1 Tax=Brucella lupini TaxID=255457 RepID=A0A256GBN0_9HYPH|nr:MULTISPECIES: response regulator transcription factor [Brucella]RNL46619.1 DNA-binding response regulator [Ochrobactrum sp. MH181795]KAB2706177.1 response regulator transcription factor [Brucella lupini]KAB2725930.1 response regulator transcription factor [Brucella anthropi]KAB2743242.1 response regulator transcription factor [Brucella anthropi]KAB2798414.1 response regulator transcription factor [Brucella anthropi]
MIIVAKHTLVRTSIVKFLEYELADCNVVGMASLTELVKASRRDIALIALDLGGRAMDSSALREELLTVESHFQAASIALFSNKDDVLLESQAIKMGVRGFFTSSLPVEIALAGIRLVLAGGIFCPHPQGAQSTIQTTISLKDRSTTELADDGTDSVNYSWCQPAITGFTPREVDVLTELQRGHSNKVIAEKLNLSGNTVKMHLQHIMRKLHVQNRTEVVLLLGAKATANGSAIQ